MQIHPVLLATLAATILTANAVAAQTTEGTIRPVTSSWELIVPSGTVVPTGAQRGAIKRGNLTAVQLTYVARSTFGITGTFGWARSKDLGTVGDPKIDVFTYDVGAEARAPKLLEGKSMTLSPFIGAGAGGRSYNYRSLEVDATHNVAAYGSAGGEIGVRRVRVRLEARDYITGFKPLTGNGPSRTGHDIVLMAGLRFVSR